MGLARSLFRSVPDQILDVLKTPFTALMREQTGVEGQAVVVPDALELGRQLHDGEIHLGVFHGVEFAWAQHRYPNLKPLVIAINNHRRLTANLVVHKDSTATKLRDLKGKHLLLPVNSREHSRLFYERVCREEKITPGSYFGKLSKNLDMEEALNQVAGGEGDGIIVDGVALESYRLLRPAACNELKIVQKSEVFPAAVIAYRDNGLTAGTLARIAQGLCNASRNPRCQGLLLLVKLTAFEFPPEDYQQTLNTILKAYPPPEVRPVVGAAAAAAKVTPAVQAPAP